jgi:hypothetical protein
MGMANHQIDPPGPLLIPPTKLRVLIPVGVGLLVLHPQQLQRHTLAPQLPVHPSEIRWRARHPRRRCRWEQRPLQRLIIELVGQRPAQPGAGSPVQIPMHRRRRDPQRPGNLAFAQPGLVTQPEHFSDLSHGGSGPRHPLPRSQDRTVMSERGCRSPPTPVPQRHTLQTGAPKPPEPVLHYPRNDRFITPGTTAPFRSERVLHYVRRAHDAVTDQFTIAVGPRFTVLPLGEVWRTNRARSSHSCSVTAPLRSVISVGLPHWS